MDTISRIPGYGKLAALLLIISVIIGLSTLTVSKGEEITSVLVNTNNQLEELNSGIIVSQDSLLAQSKIAPLPQEVQFVITAYSSSPDETDDTPFITAAGTSVRPGVAAANFLPIGTKIRLPDVFGEQVFIIEDRMHHQFSDRIDIWLGDKETAKIFGKQLSRVEIL